MPQNKIILNKPIGETPLEIINYYKRLHPEYRYLPMTYAGRLDPLAEGVLLLLAGEECLKKDEYLSLSKEYELTLSLIHI
jgi:tRNA U55 pseudouridine synthase TruB